MRYILLLFTFCWINQLLGQDEKASVSGYVYDEKGIPVEFVNVFDTLTLSNGGTINGTVTNQDGYYELEIPASKNVVVGFTFTGYKSQYFKINLPEGSFRSITVNLFPGSITGKEFEIKDKSARVSGVTRIDKKLIDRIPGGTLENILPLVTSASSNNELSSQYSVRGGNFDENLVYVNGFEINRPFLIRSGQQEGLSFINPNLISGVTFSAGGFEAKYGDKMSSVLDVTYKRPREFKGSVSGGLLGVAGHLEGASKDQLFTWLLGVRYKSNAYLLNALPTDGTYTPSFLDVQTYLTYDLTDEIQLQYLGNYAANRYEFIPESRVSSFGVINDSRRLEVFFDGQERDRYISSMNGVGIRYQPPDGKLSLRLLSSVYVTDEVEAYDIIGEYFIGQVETSLGEEDFGDVTRILGVGTFHDFARNRLSAVISNTEHKGSYEVNDAHFLQWGLGYKRENIQDRLHEWDRVDSAGFSQPTNFDEVLLTRTLDAEANLLSNRYSAYLQDSWSPGKNGVFSAIGGVRLNYWDLNDVFFASPRLTIAVDPVDSLIFKNDTASTYKKDLLLRFSTGAYFQPPFFREMRNYDGVLNTSLLPQKSWHFVLGGDYEFEMWDRPFKFVAEAYYKYMWDLVPYDIDNVLIRYYGENLARGYAAGIDLRLNGEFVPGAESWFSVGFLQSQEDLEGDFYTETRLDSTVTNGEVTYFDAIDTVDIGWLNRPTDQRVNVGILFQDYLPGNENFKMHLKFLYGTGLPFGPPNLARYRNALRMPSYKRVDIGFSASIFDSTKKKLPANNPLKNFESLWASLEIFNLLGFNNTVSYLWVEDFRGQAYAVPNFLTSRLINARFIAKF